MACAEAWLRERGRDYVADEEARLELANDLIIIGRHTQIELRLRERPMRVQPGPRPEVMTIARAESARGYVSSPVHHKIELDLLDQHIVALLDGTHEPEAAARALTAEIAAGSPSMEIDGAETRDPAIIGPVVEKRVLRAVKILAAWGLLAPA